MRESSILKGVAIMSDVYVPPQHHIAVSALVKNDKDEILLVKTHWRSDTWEFPGGNV